MSGAISRARMAVRRTTGIKTNQHAVWRPQIELIPDLVAFG